MDELRHNEDLVRDLGAEFAASPGLKYTMAPGEVGHEDLAAALAEFQDASRQSAGILRDVTAEAADRLHDTAIAYLEGDQATAERIDGRTR